MSSKPNLREEELTTGQMLGRYELLMPIGKGGMGNVWAARLKGSRGFRKLVAVKTILRTLERAGLEQMLFQEAMLASQIHHPNVAETLELGEHEGTLYLVMELVSGESLRFILREAHAHGGMPLSVAINVIGQVCRGLAAAHDLRDENGERVGLVHRDISPPNIMITDAGTVKLVDFGVATTTSGGGDTPGEIKGKLSYLAPEQLRAETVDARADVFATGILLYLLTVGCHPFRTSSESGTIARVLSEAPAATPSLLIEDYPAPLERIVMRALHKDRQERFQSITALLEALENAFPEAFGPRPDEAAALWLQRLMNERILERKATLRMAEELAEKSHRAYSLPVVTVSSVPLAKSPRAALGLVLAACLAAAALAGTRHLQGLRPVALHSALALTPGAAPTAVTALQSASAVQDGAAAEVIAASAQTPPIVALPTTLITSNTLRAKRAHSARSAREGQRELVTEAPAAERFTTSAAPEPQAEPQAVPSQPDLRPNTTEASPPPPPPPLAPAVAPPLAFNAAAVAPKLVSSKLGQSQLLSNPASGASRVRLPAGFNRMGETFSAVVNICVGATGNVSRVAILRSAGPALDAQIPGALARWHYRPLLEAGRPTPFCYKLNYEIDAR